MSNLVRMREFRQPTEDEKEFLRETTKKFLKWTESVFCIKRYSKEDMQEIHKKSGDDFRRNRPWSCFREYVLKDGMLQCPKHPDQILGLAIGGDDEIFKGL